MPMIIKYDRGNKFLGHALKMTQSKKYGIKAKYITTENPQENSILEIVHQFIANLVHT